MVGIVIVSHSRGIAEGVVELAREMGGPDVLLEAAGGLDLARPSDRHGRGSGDGGRRAGVVGGWRAGPDGSGSAVLSAEMALDMLPEERRSRVLLCEGPLVEGAVAAAVTAKLGAPLERVAQEARGGLAGKIAHLGASSTEPETATTESDATTAEPETVFRFTLDLPHGLHARPAARFVETASSFDARVTARNLTNGRGPADGRSLNAVAMLGATRDHEIEVVATGREASAAIEALRALVARRFDERPNLPEASAPPTPPDPAPAATDASILRGRSASPGIAFGPARRFHVAELSVPDEPGGDPDEELATLAAALDAGGADIARQRDAVQMRGARAEAGIFDAHLLLLRRGAPGAGAALDPERRDAPPARHGTPRSNALRPSGTGWRIRTSEHVPRTCGALDSRCWRGSSACPYPAPCSRPRA